MLKNRSFLKGLGSGFIAGALLLQIMIIAGDVNNRVPAPAGEGSPALTAELVKEKAGELGLKVYDKNAKLYDQAQLDDAVAKAVEKARAEAAAAAPAPTAGSKQINVYIMDGMPAVQVVDYLHRSGVIVDRQAFERTLIQGQYTSKIRAGLYTFGLNEKIEDVIAKLTTPPPL